jgi:polyribonucleotide nucleotidyltransferase
MGASRKTHEIHTATATVGGRTLTFETGRLAQQAGGSALVKLGDTTVLSATTAAKRPKEQLDFFPLTVDVEERMYAAGKIPAGSSAARAGPARTPRSPAA